MVDQDLTNEDIAGEVIIDGTDDLGIDAYWIEDESNKVIHLFQSKFRAEPGKAIDERDIDFFLESPSRVLDQFLVAQARNNGVKELHDHLVRLIPQDYMLHLVFVTDGLPVGRVRQLKQPRGTRVQTISSGTKQLELRIDFELFDLRDLSELYEKHSLAPQQRPIVHFQLETGSYHEIPRPFPVIDFTIPARQVIDAFHKHQYAILRLNPRGPLGVKSNKSISKSLDDESTRAIFHILNNGITAICDHWVRDGNQLTITDFQIVNGCQTTWTLWKKRSLVPEGSAVYLDVKLVECAPAMHRQISVATNTQARLKAEDLVSTDPLQEDLQKDFASLRPPWFYQLKRGEWEHETSKPEQERYRGEDGFRRVKVKEVAQAALAFLGKPGAAKDRPRFVFERRLNGGNYDDIFGEGVSAMQLLLPFKVYSRVQAEVAAEELPPEWLQYARLHLCWLIAELLRERYQLSSTSPFDNQLSGKLSDMLGKWFEQLYSIAKEAINDAVEDTNREGAYAGHREFFRTEKHYDRMRSRLQISLDRERRSWSRRNEGDPLMVLLP